MGRFLKKAFLLLLLLCMAAAVLQMAILPGEDREGPYLVSRVVDGDTIVVAISGELTKVRLIGVDTPESVAPSAYKENTPEGAEAAAFVTDLVEGQFVYLEYDTELKDQYDRTLAYVYLENGDMLQDLLLEQGLARTMTILPNNKYAAHFEELQNTAALEHQGFWKDYFVSQQ